MSVYGEMLFMVALFAAITAGGFIYGKKKKESIREQLGENYKEDKAYKATDKAQKILIIVGVITILAVLGIMLKPSSQDKQEAEFKKWSAIIITEIIESDKCITEGFNITERVAKNDIGAAEGRKKTYNLYTDVCKHVDKINDNNRFFHLSNERQKKLEPAIKRLEETTKYLESDSNAIQTSLKYFKDGDIDNFKASLKDSITLKEAWTYNWEQTTILLMQFAYDEFDLTLDMSASGYWVKKEKNLSDTQNNANN